MVDNWIVQMMSSSQIKVEPLKKGKVRHWPFTDVNEQSLRISEQLAARPNVWGVGLWPDEKTEQVAQKCAEVLANNFGLTAFSFVPEDSLINLIDIWGTDKEGLEWAITDMEDALGSTLADRAINLGGDVPFREVVMAIKEGIGRPRPIPKPPLSMKKRIILSVVWSVGLLGLMVVAGWVCRHYGVENEKVLVSVFAIPTSWMLYSSLVGVESIRDWLLMVGSLGLAEILYVIIR